MRRRAVALLLPLLLLTAACGSDDASPDGSATGASTGELPTVSGAFGEEPTIDLPSTDPGGELEVEVLEEGAGEAAAEGELLIVDYVGQRWPGTAESPTAEATESTGEPSAEPSDDAAGAFDSTFVEGATPVSFPLRADALLPGMLEGLVGQTVGSRVLLVIPPDQGFGEQGQPEIGIGPADSLVFVFDIVDRYVGDESADGTAVEPTADPALPTVSEGEDGPTVTVPSTSPAPTELVVQTLVQGDGPEVAAGQYLVVQYRGVLWKDGSEFDSSWSRGQPTGFPIGVGGVIPGWDTGLVGQQVGSRVLLVVPPAEGYGAEGRAPSIAGDDTLVFVVDILGAYGDAA